MRMVRFREDVAVYRTLSTPLALLSLVSPVAWYERVETPGWHFARPFGPTQSSPPPTLPHSSCWQPSTSTRASSSRSLMSPWSPSLSPLVPRRSPTPVTAAAPIVSPASPTTFATCGTRNLLSPPTRPSRLGGQAMTTKGASRPPMGTRWYMSRLRYPFLGGISEPHPCIH